MEEEKKELLEEEKVDTAEEEKVEEAEEQEEKAEEQAEKEEKKEKVSFEKILDTADTTAEFDKKDIEDNLAMGILAYLGILCLVPIFGAPKSKFARYHANQGLILFIAAAIVLTVLFLLGLISYVGIIFNILGYLASLVFTVLMVLGIVNAATGKAKELPIIGKFRILKDVEAAPAEEAKEENKEESEDTPAE